MCLCGYLCSYFFVICVVFLMVILAIIIICPCTFCVHLFPPLNMPPPPKKKVFLEDSATSRLVEWKSPVHLFWPLCWPFINCLCCNSSMPDPHIWALSGSGQSVPCLQGVWLQDLLPAPRNEGTNQICPLLVRGRKPHNWGLGTWLHFFLLFSTFFWRGVYL